MRQISNNENDCAPQECPIPWSLLLCTSVYFESLFACFWSRQKPLYPALPQPHSIRLLRLHPGNSGESIKCSLILASLDGPLPSYEALSYVWGEPTLTEYIECNGHRAKLATPNLICALKRLRLPRNPRLLWADAICINQKSECDKSHQVQHMQYIYRRASRVMVYLGADEEDEAHHAFAILCALVNNSGCTTKLAIFQTTDRRYEDLRYDAPPPLTSKLWSNVRAFFVSEWFTRMWVFQEIVLAQHATLLWGAAELNWTIIGNAIDIIHSETYLNIMMECRQFQNAYCMWHLGSLQHSQEKHSHPFLHLLDWARSFEVRHAEDKIYGLLGFPTKDADIKSGDRTVFMEPDYSLSVAEIYTNVTRKLLAREQNLDVLAFVTHVGEPPAYALDTTGDIHLPSWVPDWNCRHILFPLSGLGPMHRHKAGAFRGLEISSAENPLFLTQKGMILDVVKDTSSALPLTSIFEAAPILENLIQWCIDHGADAPSIAATLTAGRDANGFLTLNKKGRLLDFFAYMEDLRHGWVDSSWPEEAATTGIGRAMQDGDPVTVRSTIWKYTCYRLAFTTQGQTLGLGPGATRTGDVIIVLWGGQTPYVVREQDEGSYQFVGECYIEGLMNGEAEKMLNEYGEIERVFELK